MLGLFAVLVVGCCLADLSRPRALVALGALVVLAPVAARLPLRLLAARLTPLLMFLLLGTGLVLLVPVGPDTPTVTPVWWDTPVSAQGLAFLTNLAVKSGAIVVIALSLAHRLSERDLLEALTALRIPARVAALCYLMLRSLHGVGAETRRLMRGRDARGRAPGRRGVRVAGAMAQVLLVRLGRRAETQALALASRGFTGRLPLARYRPLTPAHVATLLAAAVVLTWLLRL